MSGRITIEAVLPVVDHGRHAAKAAVGEQVPIQAAVWREGHDAVGATVVWTRPDGTEAGQLPMDPVPGDPDLRRAVAVPDRIGMWTFRVDAWDDPWTTWTTAVRAKLDDGQSAAELANDLESGARLLERMAAGAGTGPRAALAAAVTALRDDGRKPAERAAPALGDTVARIAAARPPRRLVTRGETHRLWVDRRRALFGSWYEFFPRSTGGRDERGRPVHGTLATAAAELPRIAAMGFDIVYLPPVHPIGEVGRKGRNNALRAGPDDVGSPWAVGSRSGGHDAVHPRLGTLDDFDDFVAAAGRLDLEVALDLALQCAPDHPWVARHPEWFTTRPDGSVAYAENPPKRYEDIYPLNFDNDPDGLYAEVLRTVLFWADHGVRVFRVDNPHTKPADFWHRLLWDVRRTCPDVLFLAEAFTRPVVLKGLAKAGFTQSYTYFTWRTGKRELTDYALELAAEAHVLRPNLFVNTPDILHEVLQRGGPGMFAVRSALAATLSPTWGMYAGFELFEHQPAAPGSEEYLDSEKYELRPRDFAGALAAGRSLEPWITRLNRMRRDHPALQQLREITFHPVDDDRLLVYSKTDPESGDTVLCLISLDPSAPVTGTAHLGAVPGGRPRAARDVFTGEGVALAERMAVTLDPDRAVARFLTWNAR
ncbi:alpha-1,4-glucan--maltose-1-phosphate maltosyltransferase [Streptomyces polygonati]|uniref:Alpha-1,4-glucan:maltose-1-phosphate maltosyltransferase n=1 Tax=Streptomyces polygonati TaxID=1617087 RepID=A0ABV8HEP2_9ACTN